MTGDSSIGTTSIENRLAALEMQVHSLREQLKLQNDVMPIEEFSEGEALAMLQGPQGPPLRELLNQLEADLKTGS
jgi:hypothetical protein